MFEQSGRCDSLLVQRGNLMSDIRENIEEMIEESYLLGMSENEIRSDLDRFVETCGRVIHQHVRDRKQMEMLVEKLARARALTLIEDRQDDDDEEDDLADLGIDTGSATSPLDRFAARVARNKRTILRAIGECDARLVSLIDQERFPEPSERSPGAPSIPGVFPGGPFAGQPVSRGKDLMLKVCYAVTVLFILILAYLVLLQNVERLT